MGTLIHKRLSGRSPASKVTVDKKNNDCAEHRADQTCSFARSVPAERLSQKARYKCADDAEDGGEDEALRLIGPGMMNLAITPAMKPMMIVQMMPISLWC